MDRNIISKKGQLTIKEQKPQPSHPIVVLKESTKKILSLNEGKAHAYQLIDAWAKGQ